MTTTKNYFDGSAFNYIHPDVRSGVLEAVKKFSGGVYYQILTTIPGAHLFLYGDKDDDVQLFLGIYGQVPSVNSSIKWRVKGIRVQVEESPTEEIDYFGGNTYFHSDYYPKGEIEIF